MTQHDDKMRLLHMLENAEEALAISKGHSRTDLDSDRLLNLALVRLLEVIGEAGARVSEEVRNTYPEIQWQQIVGLRNRLIHGYDDVDFDVLWEIITGDLPALIDQLKRILGVE